MIPRDPPIAVIGEGISGLSAAIFAAKKGYHVQLISKHPPGVRSQRVYLNTEAQNVLKEFFEKKGIFDPDDPDDEAFKIKLAKPGISLGTVELFLLNKANKFGTISHIKGNVVGLDKENFQLHCKIDSTEDKKDEASLKSIPFLHAVDASGLNRVIFNLLEEKPAESKYKYQPKHLEHGAAVFDAKAPVAKAKEKIYAGLKFNKGDIKILKNNFGWDHDYPPRIFIIPKGKKKFYISGEIPKGLNGKREETKQWFQHLLKHKFKMPLESIGLKYLPDDENKERQLRGKIRVTTFKLQQTKIDSPIRNLAKDGTQRLVLAIGDALSSPFFPKAHGTGDALTTSKTFFDCLPEKGSEKAFDVKKYAEFCANLQISHQQRLKTDHEERMKEALQYGELDLSELHLITPEQSKIMYDAMLGSLNGFINGLKNQLERKSITEQTYTAATKNFDFMSSLVKDVMSIREQYKKSKASFGSQYESRISSIDDIERSLFDIIIKFQRVISNKESNKQHIMLAYTQTIDKLKEAKKETTYFSKLNKQLERTITKLEAQQLKMKNLAEIPMPKEGSSRKFKH